MAGAGYKTFVTGEVLTAANVNTYLMDQTVMVFASAAARTTALGANVSEGMISYLKDTNSTQYYDGAAWVSVGGSTTPTFVGCRLFNTGGQTISSATTTAILFDSEAFDTDNFHSTSTNTSRITIPTGKGGYYLVQGSFMIDGTSSWSRIGLYRNGSTMLLNLESGNATTGTNTRTLNFIGNFSAGDYLELLVRQNTGSNQTLWGNTAYDGNPNFQITYLGA